MYICTDNEDQMQVHKFGGASVKDAPAVVNLGKIVTRQLPTTHLVVVLSAMGKNTNSLEEVVTLYMHRDDSAADRLETLKCQHLDMANSLGLDRPDLVDKISDVFVEAEWLLEEEPQDEYDYVYDQIVGIGELVSSLVIHSYLEHLGLKSVWIDARDLIKTDDHFREGNVDWESSQKLITSTLRPHLEEGLVVTQGFIAGNNENNTITLGREGSDFTGAIMAHCLDAASLTVWKDVPGVMTSDPALFPDAQLLDRLSYQEALEMTYYGAKVIHPKTIKPLREKNIPLYVRSFLDHQAVGTCVDGVEGLKYPSIKVLLMNQVMIKVATKDYTFVVEDHLSQIFQTLVNFGIKLSLFKNLAVTCTIVVTGDDDRLPAWQQELSEDFEILETVKVELMTLRHFNPSDLIQMRSAHKVLLEEYNQTTAQWVIAPE